MYECVCGYLACLKAVSPIRNPKMGHAVATRVPLNMDFNINIMQNVSFSLSNSVHVLLECVNRIIVCGYSCVLKSFLW
jgi:hypothetical protein